MSKLIQGTVMAVSNDEILFKHNDGKIERIKRDKIERIVCINEPEPMFTLKNGQKIRAKDSKPGDEIMAYITNPGTSTHMGTRYGGFCLER